MRSIFWLDVKRYTLPLTLAVGLMVSAAPSNAAIITGSLSINGSVRVSATNLDFGQNGIGVDGLFNVTNGTDYFSGYIGGLLNAGDLRDLTDPAGPVSVLGFLQMLLGPRAGLVVNATNLLAGGGPPCPPALPSGSSCTAFAGSPLLITRAQGGGSSVTLVVDGNAVNGADTANNVRGIFTAQTNQTPEALLAAVGPGGPGFVDASYSAEFTFADTTVPEPTTVSAALLGLGLIGFGAWRRRRS
jgi:MYXO-CTERM domain-containing protein